MKSSLAAPLAGRLLDLADGDGDVVEAGRAGRCRLVAAISAEPVIGIQPCAVAATRRRVSLALPPSQIGMGPDGRGRASRSRALKWVPS